MSEVQRPQSMQGGGMPSRPQRKIHWFEIPVTLRPLVGHDRVGLVELTAGEMQMAGGRCRNDLLRLADEYAKESLRRLDDAELTSSDGTVDAAWSGMHAKLRSLVTNAYGYLHNPENDEVKGFLSSHEIRPS